MARWRWYAFPLLLAAAGAGYFLFRPGHPEALPDETIRVTTPVATAETAKPEASAHTLSTLAADLASSDGKTRAMAAELLSRTTYRQRDELLGILDATKDAKVREMLNNRINAIQTQVTAKLPPISLHVHNAPLYDVVTALNAEMGTQIKYSASSNATPGLYTLDVSDTPFWDVIMALHRQHPFRILGDGGMALAASTDTMQWSAVSGPILFYVFTRPSTFINKPTLQFYYFLVADPRLRVAQYKLTVPPGNPPRNPLVLGPDSAGNMLELAASSGGGNLTATGMMTGSYQYAWPAAPGKTLSSLQISGTAVAAVSEARVTVDEIDQMNEWQTIVANVSIQLRTLPPSGRVNTSSLQLSVGSPTGSRILGDQPLATLWITDAANVQCWMAAFGPDFGGGTRTLGSAMNGGKGPYRLHVNVPTETAEIPMSFALKDIAIPAKAQ